MPRKALLLLAMFLLPGPVLAAEKNWIYATKDQYATAYYQDQVACLDGDQVSVSLKIDLSRKGLTHFKKEHKNADRNFKYFINKKVYDCKRAKSASYHLTTYSPDGTVVEDASWNESEITWHKVAPDSNDDFIMEELCMVCSNRGR